MGEENMSIAGSVSSDVITSVTGSSQMLTDAQVEQFDRDGYLVLRNRIRPDLLHRLQDAAVDWVEQGHRAVPGSAGDWLFADRPSGRVMYRVDYIHAKGRPESLELLGS